MSDWLEFYQLMNYKKPINFYLFKFLIEKKESSNIQLESNISNDNKYSFDEKSDLMSEYVDFINKYGNLYKSIPFVKSIYLCNSITFNALNKESDIDIFIVSKEKSMWLCRFFSVLYFHFAWIRRYWKKIRKRFCLNFYVDESSMNLFDISLKPIDIYLVYWLAHLIPLYSEDSCYIDDMYTKNKWITNFLSNIKLKQNINIWTEIFTWTTSSKKVFEKILWWKIWKIFWLIIRFFWINTMIGKKKKLWKKSRWMIISDNILKFHWNDVRKQVNYKYRIITKIIS